MTYLSDNFDLVWDLTLKHIWLSVIPIVVGFVVAVPIGWVASRHTRLRGILLSVGSVVYTIPSLPLFVIIPSIIGIGILSPANVVIALSLYAAAIMLRSATDAFLAVSPEVLDAAKASGYSPAKLFLSVQLPLAGPVLLAGLRVVSVSTVSMVSVGAIIGVSSLGSLFTRGFQLGYTEQIVVGVVFTVLLALALDVLLVVIGKLAMPWSSVVRAAGANA